MNLANINSRIALRNITGLIPAVEETIDILEVKPNPKKSFIFLYRGVEKLLRRKTHGCDRCLS